MHVLEWKGASGRWVPMRRRVYFNAQDALAAAERLRKGLRAMVRVRYP